MKARLPVKENRGADAYFYNGRVVKRTFTALPFLSLSDTKQVSRYDEGRNFVL